MFPKLPDVSNFTRSVMLSLGGKIGYRIVRLDVVTDLKWICLYQCHWGGSPKWDTFSILFGSMLLLMD